MCPSPRHAWCGLTGCTITPTRRRWRIAGPTWGNRPWPCRCLWRGRRRVPSGGTSIQSGVRPAGSCSCAPRSSRVGVRRRQHWRRSVPHDVRSAGETSKGRGAPRVCPVVAGGRLRGGGGTPQRRIPRSPVPQTGLLWGAPGRMPAGEPGIISIAGEGNTSLARVGTRAVQHGVEADTWPPRVGCQSVILWRPGAA